MSEKQIQVSGEAVDAFCEGCFGYGTEDRRFLDRVRRGLFSALGIERKRWEVEVRERTLLEVAEVQAQQKGSGRRCHWAVPDPLDRLMRLTRHGGAGTYIVKDASSRPARIEPRVRTGPPPVPTQQDREAARALFARKRCLPASSKEREQ